MASPQPDKSPVQEHLIGAPLLPSH